MTRGPLGHVDNSCKLVWSSAIVSMLMALRALWAALRRPWRRAQKQATIWVKSQAESSAASLSSTTGRSAASRVQHGCNHAHAKPGRTVPELGEDGPDPGLDEEPVQLGTAVVDSGGYFLCHPVQRDAFLSSIGPQAVGMRLQRRFLLGAGHTGISDGVERRRLVGQCQIPEVTDPLDL